jgi:hypothetical protein
VNARTSDADFEGKQFDPRTRASDSTNTMGVFGERPNAFGQAVCETPAGEVKGVDPRIFSQVYSYIVKHRGSDYSGMLVELISAICLERSELYFEALARLQSPARDLGLELVKAKIYEAFRTEAWQDASLLASELNQSPTDEATDANLTVREMTQGAKDSAPPTGKSLENRWKGDSEQAIAMRSRSAELEARPAEESCARERRPFWRSARTALLYAFQRAGFDNFKHLWGAVAAATVIGVCALLVVLDEVERRPFTPWLAEPLGFSSQVQDPVQVALDEPAQDVPARPASEEASSPEPVRVGIDEPAGMAPEEASKAEPVILSEAHDSAPLEEERVIEQAAVEDEIVVTLPLTSLVESAAPADSSLRREAPVTESPVKETPATKLSAAPKPVEKKLKSDRGSKTAAPSLVKRSAPRRAIPAPNPQVADTKESITNQMRAEAPEAPSVETPPAEQPPAVSEPLKSLATEDRAPTELTAAIVEKPASSSVAKSEPVPVKAPKKRETLLEDWLGFKPDELIAKFQPGRRANQPHFIRQLEGVEGPIEGHAD